MKDLFHPDRIDIPSTVGAFAAGGEEGGVLVGVEGMDLDVSRTDSATFKDPPVRFEKVDVVAPGHGASVSRALEGPDLRQGETGIAELLHHFFSHLETFGADGRADDGLEVRRTGAEPFSHERDRTLGNHLDRPFPTRMDSGDDMVDGIGKEDGNTIGRPYADSYPGKVRDKSVKSLQILPRHIRPVDDCDL